ISQKIGSLLVEISDEISQNNPYCQIFIKSKLLEIHGILLRNIPRNTHSANLTKSYLVIKKVQDVINYANHHYKEPITLSSAAALAGLGISQFSKLFKSLCGMSFTAYLNNVRISKAEEMLTNTTTSITDIALECGFNSIRNFNRTYKALRHSAPSHLRKA
ncbi:MAG: hypothetical protein K0S30_1372, partial [Clostridia bacterium]|nr:hypothetical protein [Clostridia bacterium]